MTTTRRAVIVTKKRAVRRPLAHRVGELEARVGRIETTLASLPGQILELSNLVRGTLLAQGERLVSLEAQLIESTELQRKVVAGMEAMRDLVLQAVRSTAPPQPPPANGGELIGEGL